MLFKLTVRSRATCWLQMDCSLVLAILKTCELGKQHELCWSVLRRLLKQQQQLKWNEMMFRFVAQTFSGQSLSLPSGHCTQTVERREKKEIEIKIQFKIIIGISQSNKNYTLRTIWHCCNLFTLNSSCSVVYLLRI